MREVGQERRVDREELELEALRGTIYRGVKCKLDCAQDKGGWLTVFPFFRMERNSPEMSLGML